MSLWSRLVRVLRADRVIDEIDEELTSHVDEAIAQGRDPAEARKAFGSLLRRREESRDVRLLPWAEGLYRDAAFSRRQLARHKVTSTAAILSLALAIGACTAAFRLIDALLFRPLPVSQPERLYLAVRDEVGRDGVTRSSDGLEYPVFRALRDAARAHADLIAISFAERIELTYGSGGAGASSAATSPGKTSLGATSVGATALGSMSATSPGSEQQWEKAWRQYVSGGMFASFGIRPAIGRLLTASDDLQPRAHPYAVLSHDYWTHRFGQDPAIVGRTLRTGRDVYEIVGVAEARFTGTEPGTMTDIFVPAMMHPGTSRFDWAWLRAFVRPKPGVTADTVRDAMLATFRSARAETAKQFVGRPRQTVDRFLEERLRLEPASAGVSQMQADYRAALAALAMLVSLVLLIACANVANLIAARAMARSREMALRVSIGAGRSRLVQLVLVECAWLAGLAALIGGLFAQWAAPLVVSLIGPPDNPVRLSLDADWRAIAFGLVLAFGVTVLCGLPPALRASAIDPIVAIKGGDHAPPRRRMIHALIALQVAFCVFVLFLAGLFATTFARLSNQPVGFAVDRLLTVDVVTVRAQPEWWEQVADHLRALPGVERVAFTSWPLLSGNRWSTFIAIDGVPQPRQPLFLTVSPGWTDVMHIPFVAGRDFRPTDAYPSVAIVNQAFVREYFGDRNPLGRIFLETPSRGNALPLEAAGTRYRVQIVGVVGDARYMNVRDPAPPTVYVPFRSVDANGAPEPIGWGSFLVRTADANPLALAPIVRREVPRARSEFRVSAIRTQRALVESHTVRERLLATLVLFFAGLALLLAAIGLFGVLHYTVMQRRREIGIRLALGSGAGNIARRVSLQIFGMVAAGAVAGLALGLASQRYVQTLLYQVSGFDPAMLGVPLAAIFAVAILAALPPVINALRTNPLETLRLST